MINYKLAKQLKDAGFPQTRNTGHILENCTCGSTEYLGGNKVHSADGDCLLIEPTLSELIEACGGRMEELSSLSHPPKEPTWAATAYSCEECGWNKMVQEYGSTPEEAVTRLYLALNEKKYD